MRIFNDFTVTIEADRKKGYKVRAEEQLSQGTVNVVNKQPEYFQADELFRRLPQLHRAIISAVHQTRFDERIIHEFGCDLFNGVFKGAVRKGFYRALSVTQASASAQGLRIRLRLPSALQELPWELMRYARTDEEDDNRLSSLLCLNGMITLVRTRQKTQPPATPPVNLPLKILVIVASPFGYSPIEARKEIDYLLSSLTVLIREGKVQIDFVRGADTLRKLRQKIRQNGSYHILHFIGHGEKSENDLYLVLEDNDCRPQKMTPEQLYHLLVALGLPRLVFLNACEGAKTSLSSPIITLAESFLQAGVPAVIAHQFDITYGAAEVMARHLYEELSNGMPVDEALAQARSGVDVYLPSSIESCTPILFLNNQTGDLFPIVLGAQPPLPSSGFFIGQAKNAQIAHPPQWAEVVDYAQEALIIQPNYTEAQSLRDQALAEEQLAGYLHEAAFAEHLSHSLEGEAQIKYLREAVNWYEKYEKQHHTLGRVLAELERVSKLKQQVQDRINQLHQAVEEQEMQRQHLRRLQKQLKKVNEFVWDPELLWKG